MPCSKQKPSRHSTWIILNALITQIKRCVTFLCSCGFHACELSQGEAICLNQKKKFHARNIRILGSTTYIYNQVKIFRSCFFFTYNIYICGKIQYAVTNIIFSCRYQVENCFKFRNKIYSSSKNKFQSPSIKTILQRDCIIILMYGPIWKM